MRQLETDYLLVYGGREEAGEERHLFDLKRSLEHRSEGTLFLSEGDDGGVAFELIPGFSLLDRKLEVRFETEIYVFPEGVGTVLNSRSEVRSVRSNFFPNSEMVVAFLHQIRTE